MTSVAMKKFYGVILLYLAFPFDSRPAKTKKIGLIIKGTLMSSIKVDLK